MGGVGLDRSPALGQMNLLAQLRSGDGEILFGCEKGSLGEAQIPSHEHDLQHVDHPQDFAFDQGDRGAVETHGQQEEGDGRDGDGADQDKEKKAAQGLSKDQGHE